jgi:membrane protease YdiL (CAAX protease family)
LEEAPTPPPAAPLRPFLHPLLRATLYLIAFVIVQVIVTTAVIAGSRLLPARFANSAFARSDLLFLLIVGLVFPPVIGLTRLFVRYLDRKRLADIGARWPRDGRRGARRQLLTVSLGALAVIAAWFALALALPDSLVAIHLGGLSPGVTTAPPPWWPLPPALLFPIFLVLFLIQGGLEEWVVRGYIYHALRERWRPWAAALASSILFSLLHAFNPDVSAVALVNIVLAGLVLAALVEHDGSLWGATLAHGVWNFTLSCIASLPVSGIPVFHLLNVQVTGDPRVTGGGFGPEGSVVLTAMGAVLTALLWWRVARRRPARAAEDTPPYTPEDIAPVQAP